MSTPDELTHVIRLWSEVFMHRSLGDFKRFMSETGLSIPARQHSYAPIP